jgi:pimeloyl-ACP methyl ester carboxylesterase
LSEATVRNGEQAVLAVDAVALLDALGIETAIVAGFDWGRAPQPSSPPYGPSASAACCP